MRKILITGANSYIGDSFKEYLVRETDKYKVDILDTIGMIPTPELFIGYDVVFNVAGIAHRKETKENRSLYYAVNRDMVIKIAKAAKKAGVKQFILLSSMSVYGKNVGRICKTDKPRPNNAYGKSKAQADIVINKLAGDSFCFTCLRPPMVYGKGCRGNYQSLRSFALKFPIFPLFNNSRSMIYIGNLCEFIKKCIDEEKSGVFFPQNDSYVNTSEMVRQIAKCHGRKIWFTKLFNIVIRFAPIGLVKKVFGDLTYEKTDTVNKYSFIESIEATEG